MIWTPAAIIVSFAITYFTMPLIIDKMKKGDMVGHDINKPDRPPVAEMGGIGALLGFALGASITIGILKLQGYENETPVLVAISVFSIAAIVGLFDDIAILTRGEKALFIGFAALPLMISTIGRPSIDLIFTTIRFNGGITVYLYWMILVPIGITGMANALNMSAGYNGLEAGQFSIISGSLLVVNYFQGGGDATYLIFGSLFGSASALYLFNRFPAKTFVGDVGTLGFGATLAAGVIMADLELFGLICIIPAFYEMQATIRYKIKKIERRDACMNPVIMPDGKLAPPKGAENYTLFYKILSIKHMKEGDLVYTALGLYLICGILAIVLSVVS